MTIFSSLISLWRMFLQWRYPTADTSWKRWKELGVTTQSALDNWCGITAFPEPHFGLFWHYLNKIYILIMVTGNGLRPACQHCCSALGRDTLKSLCCFPLTNVQEEGMLQSWCDCEHRSSLLQSSKLLYFYASFIWRVLWFLQEDITVCLPYCRMTRHLRAKFGINNRVIPKFHSSSCTIQASVP